MRARQQTSLRGGCQRRHVLALAHLGNRSIVHLHLGWRVANQHAARDLALRGNPKTLRDGGVPGANSHRDLGFSKAVVGDIDRNQPLVGRRRVAGKDSTDRKIGQPAITIHPVVKEPLQVLTCRLLQQPLEVLGRSVFLWAISGQRRGQLSIAHQVAQHPEDIGRLGAVVDDV